VTSYICIHIPRNVLNFLYIDALINVLIYIYEYVCIYIQGVSFPEDQEATSAAFDIAPPASASPSTSLHSEFRPKNEDEFKKLELDLLTVFEKVICFLYFTAI
jgi:hypothetical protein